MCGESRRPSTRRSRAPRRVTFAGAALAAVFLAAAVAPGGCIFSPREPDGPPEGDSTNWETPVSTAIVLSNLTAALEDENQANYRDCFTEDYRFHVDPADSLDAGQEAEERYGDWTREVEEQYAANLFAVATDIELDFSNVIAPDESSDDTYREDDYVLTVTREPAPDLEIEEVYIGRAVLYLRRDAGGRWAIYRWADQRTVDPDVNATWGVLRGDYRD